MPENQAVLLQTTAVAKPSRPARQRRYFFRHGQAALGLFILLAFIALALLAPALVPGDPLAIVDGPYLKPSAAHPFGTNAQGQDVFAQVIWGTGSTLLIAFTIGITTTLIGAAVGLTAGCRSGTIDKALSSIVNLFLIIPGLPMMLMLAVFLQPGTATLIFVLTFTGWARPAYTIRAQVRALHEKDFVFAAAINDKRSPRMALTDVLPNMITPIAASLIGATAYALGASIALEFLGLGNVNQASWGTLFFWAHNMATWLAGAWWMFVPVGLCTALLAFALALLYYALTDLTYSRRRAAPEASHAVQKLYNKNQHATPVVRNTRK